MSERPDFSQRYRLPDEGDHDLYVRMPQPTPEEGGLYEWYALFPETLAALFPQTEDFPGVDIPMARRLLPAQLLGKNRSESVLAVAMQKEVKGLEPIRGNRNLIGILRDHKITTIRDFLAWNCTDEYIAALVQKYPTLLGKVSAAFARPLLQSPHARLAHFVIAPETQGMDAETYNLTYSQQRENNIRNVVSEVLTPLHPQQQLVLDICYGLRSGVGKDLKATGLEVGLNRENVRQIQERAIHNLRKPDTIDRLLGLLAPEDIP